MGLSWILPCWAQCSRWDMRNIPEVSSKGLGVQEVHEGPRLDGGGPFLRRTLDLT